MPEPKQRKAYGLQVFRILWHPSSEQKWKKAKPINVNPSSKIVGRFNKKKTAIVLNDDILFFCISRPVTWEHQIFNIFVSIPHNYPLIMVEFWNYCTFFEKPLFKNKNGDEVWRPNILCSGILDTDILTIASYGQVGISSWTDISLCSLSKNHWYINFQTMTLFSSKLLPNVCFCSHC